MRDHSSTRLGAKESNLSIFSKANIVRVEEQEQFTSTLFLGSWIQGLPAVIAATLVEVWSLHPTLHPHMVVPAWH